MFSCRSPSLPQLGIDQALLEVNNNMSAPIIFSQRSDNCYKVSWEYPSLGFNTTLPLSLSPLTPPPSPFLLLPPSTLLSVHHIHWVKSCQENCGTLFWTQLLDGPYSSTAVSMIAHCCARKKWPLSHSLMLWFAVLCGQSTSEVRTAQQICTDSGGWQLYHGTWQYGVWIWGVLS